MINAGTPPGYSKTAAEAGRQSGLFPPARDRIRIDDSLTRALAAADDRVRRGPVVSPLARNMLSAELARFDFNDPVSLDDVLAWTIGWMENGLVHVNHPRYFGLFNPAPTFPAQCADRIVACFNPQLATETTSPFAVRLEAHVISAIATRLGMPACAAGHFTTGGAEANYTAAICALGHANVAFGRVGARAFTGQPICYVSKDAHLAWVKIAHQAGIGREAIRLVATDGSGKMDAASLARCVEADAHEGRVPFMIVATAGTTSAGMIDPIDKCGDIADRFGLWFHVDAAWGGAAIASERLRHLLAGAERADSITIDAHKWFATTMASGMFLTSRPDALGASFRVTMDCMPSSDAALDPYMTTMQWSRRFIGLRLFLALATAGWAGYAAHIERTVALSDLLSEKLTRNGWTKVNGSRLGVVCLRPPSGAPEPRNIAQVVLRSGEAWVSVVEFEGQSTIRACVTHGACAEQDIDRLVTALIAACNAARSPQAVAYL